ncbi:hypothetical protein Tco_0064930 [Tanacetum coccineum]
MLLGKFGVARQIWCCQANLVLPGKFDAARQIWCCQANLVLSGKFGAVRQIWCCQANLMLPGKFGAVRQIWCCQEKVCNTKSTKELATAEDTRNVKTKKDEVLDSAKVLESLGKVDEGTGEVAAVNDNTKTLDGKAEAEDGKTDNAKMGDDPMSEDTSIIKEEVVVTVMKEKPEVGSTVVEVQKVTEEEEGLQVKDGNKDGISVELSLACSNGQNLSTEVVNAEVNVTYPKAKVDVTDTLFGHVAPTKSSKAKLLTEDREGALADIESGPENHLMLADVSSVNATDVNMEDALAHVSASYEQA